TVLNFIVVPEKKIRCRSAVHLSPCTTNYDAFQTNTLLKIFKRCLLQSQSGFKKLSVANHIYKTIVERFLKKMRGTPRKY
ncbi:hypothetical protein L9F63_017444, partial [Diploptera punctata]